MYYYSSSIVCSNKTIMIYISFFEQSKLCERRGATVKVVVGKMLKGKSLVKDLLEGRGFESRRHQRRDFFFLYYQCLLKTLCLVCTFTY